MRIPYIVLAVIAAIVFTAGGAHADVVAASTDLTFWQNLQVQVITALSGLVGVVLLWLVTWIRLKFKVDIQAKYRDSLHSAIMSGVLLGLKNVGFSDAVIAQATAAGGGLADAGGAAGGAAATPQPIALPVMDQATKDQVVNVATEYAKTSTPTAIKQLKATTDILQSLAGGKLEGILTGILTGNPLGVVAGVIGALQKK